MPIKGRGLGGGYIFPPTASDSEADEKASGPISAALGKSGWPGSLRRLGAFGCDGQKERGPALSGWPSLVRLYESLPCRCSYTIAHFSVVVNNFLVAAGAFVCCCIRVACGRPLEVRSRPRAGGGWAPAGLVALQAAALRTACGVAVILAGRQRARWWPAGPLRFRSGWAFRCLTASGGCGVSVAAAATGQSP